MNQKQIVRIITIFTILLLWGCMNSSLTFQVRYADVSGLKQNDPVYFSQNKVGHVQKVSYTKQGDYLVDIYIAPEFKNVATLNSKFYIGGDFMNRQQNKAVIIEQEKPGGTLLEKGVIVKGSVKTGFFEKMMSDFRQNADAASEEMNKAKQKMEKSWTESSRKMDKEMEDTLDDLSWQFQEFKEEMKKAPDSDEVKQLKESIKQLADEYKKAQDDVRDYIRNDVLPQLQKELDQLRDKLQGQEQEEEIEEIDKMVEEMNMV